jgi:hypothetical protein
MSKTALCLFFPFSHIANPSQPRSTTWCSLPWLSFGGRKLYTDTVNRNCACMHMDLKDDGVWLCVVVDVVTTYTHACRVLSTETPAAGMHQYQHCTAHWYGASSMHASSWMHGVQSWIWNVAQQFLYTHLPADIQTLRNTTLLHMIYFVVVNCKYTLHAVGRYGDTRTALMETIDDERSWGHRSIWVHGLDGFWWIQVHAGGHGYRCVFPAVQAVVVRAR